MAFTIKTGTIPDKITSLILVDTSDSDTIKDLVVANTQPTVHVDVTTSTGEWGAHFATLADGTFGFKGLSYSSPANPVALNFSTGMTYFILCNGASAPGGSGQVITDTTGSGIRRNTPPSFYLNGGIRGNQATTALPTDSTAFMSAGVYDRDNTQEFYYGVEGGSLASDSTAVDPSFWGSDANLAQIGGVSGFGNSPMEVFMVGISTSLLTLTELQTIFADPIGTLVDTGTAVPTITDVNTDEIVAQGETTVPITGTNFEAVKGTGSVKICSADNIATNPVTQTTTGTWSDTAVEFTANFTGTTVAEGGTAYVFVTNATGDSNASGFAITREDITVPTQTNPTANSITTDGVTPSCTANEAGTMYMVLVPNADVPSVAQIKAGQQSSGAAAIASENAACAASVEEVFTPVTGLALLTSYELYFVTNDGTNDSTAATVGFTTLAAPTITTTALKNYSGQLQVSQTGWTVDVYTRSTGALVLHKTGLATDTGGIIAFSDASLSASTSYRIVTDNGTDMFGIQSQTTT